MQSGNIVEYIDRQRIICALVLEPKSQRLHLLTEHDRELNLAAQRLSHTSGDRIDPGMGRSAVVQHLRDIAARRQSLSEQVDVKSLWDIVHSEADAIDLPTMTSLVFPNDPDADHESAVIRALFRNRLYFKFNVDSFVPYTEKQVQQMAAKAEKEAEAKRLTETGAQWLKNLHQCSGTPAPPPENVARVLMDYYLFGKESAFAAVAKTILRDAGVQHEEDIFRLLVKAGIWQKDEHIDLLRHQVPRAFSPAATARVAQCNGIPVRAEGPRRDLTGLPLITIDGRATLDFDDALSIEPLADGHRVGIHISDVAHFVKKDDPLDQEARNRGSSLYFPDHRIPMLPPDLSENLCSLMAGQVRPAISIMVDTSRDGTILGYDIFPSIVRVVRQLTYSEADLLAASDPALRALHAVARRLRQWRLEQGAVHISLPEVSVQMDAAGRPVIARVEREAPARMLVAEMMILANWTMARFLSEHRTAAVFRSQPAPRTRLFQGDEGTLFQNWMQRRHLSRFVLDTTADRHAGLGLDAYVTATSPIRKYYDLITQRQIRAISGLEVPYSREEMDALLRKLEHPMRYVPRLQYMRHRYWLLRHLETQVGQKTGAVVLGKRRDTYQILLPDYLTECVMPASGGIKLKPEENVQVTIQHVNARKDDLTVFMG